MNFLPELNTLLKGGRNIIFFFFIFSSLESCVVSRPLYPGHWSPRIKNAPLQSYSGQYHPALIKIIIRDTLKIDSVYCSADFDITDDLEFKIITNCANNPDSVFFRKANNDILFSGNFNRKKISIRNKKKGIQILYRSSIAGNPLVGVSKEYILLSKSIDGSLIIKDGNWSYGFVFFIIPIGINEYSWYRIHKNTIDIVNKESK